MCHVPVRYKITCNSYFGLWRIANWQESNYHVPNYQSLVYATRNTRRQDYFLRKKVTMSVQPESIGVTKPIDHVDAPPEIEYRMITHDSLSMFFAAIGGAVLGMLLTLLVLALVNGGTLSFSTPRIVQLEEYVTRVDGNLGAVSDNINLISDQAASLQQQLGSVETALRGELETQSGDITTLQSSVETLQVTRQQFGYFVDALNTALGDMQAMDPTIDQEETSAAQAPTTATTTTAVEPASSTAEKAAVAPLIESTSDLPGNAIAVVPFLDEDGDGSLGVMETNLIGILVSLQRNNGEVIATEESSDAGILFADLAIDEYQIIVEDTLGYTLLSEATAAVTVADEEGNGNVVYFPISAE